MAAYASTVTLDNRMAERMTRSYGVLSGTIHITNYNSTTVAESDITKHFRAIKVLIVQTSENGYELDFDESTGKFKAFQETSAGAKTEADDDTDIGEAQFLAIGLIGGR